MRILLTIYLLITAYPAQAMDDFQDCPACPTMIDIPLGSFMMGFDEGKKSERPRHKALITRAFAIARTETTFDQYKACVDDNGCKELPWDRDWGMGMRPVIYVSYQDALDYADWLSEKTGRLYRLPTEIEWEYAAWGGQQLPPPTNRKRYRQLS